MENSLALPPKKQGFIKRHLKGAAAVGTAVIIISCYAFFKWQADSKYAPYERQIDSTYQANGLQVQEDNLRPLARLQHEYNLTAKQMLYVRLVKEFLSNSDSLNALYKRNHVPYTSDDLRAYLASEGGASEKMVLDILYRYRRVLLSQSTIRAEIVDICRKQYNDYLIIISVLQGARRIIPNDDLLYLSTRLKSK